MVSNKSIGQRIFDLFNTVFMLFMIMITLYPMLYVLFASLSDPADLMKNTGLLYYPLGFNLDSYIAVFNNPLIKSGYANTIFIVICGVALNIAMSSLGAYFLSRKDLYWKKVVLFMIIITMYFGGGLIPFYLTVKGLGLYNTRLALILPSAISTYNMIIMRTAFQSIPSSLEESAKIDGARHFTVLIRIIIPLAMPTIAVMVLFYGVGHWNSWFNAMIFLNDKAKYPLQLILRDILIQSQTADMSSGVSEYEKQSVSETIKYATIVVATAPILVLYPFLQRYFEKGVMVGSLKG